MDAKAKWRQTLLAKRKSISSETVREASRRIASRFFSLEAFSLAERIALYAATPGEVETETVFTRAHAERKEIFYPACDGKGEDRQLHFYRVEHLADLRPGFAGILEPVQRVHPVSNLQFLDLIVVPGIGFDREGNRLGHGEGYYDRVLQGFKGKRVAFAFEWQIVDELPVTLKDQRMDWIVTEERVLAFT